MALPPPKTSARRLLVEGPDDKGICAAFLERAKIGDVWIEDKGGYETLRDSIGAELRQSGRTYLGIIMDADGNALDRWQSIAAALKDFGIEAPEALPKGGCVIRTEDRPCVGIWMMPDNLSPGTVEDFVAALVPADDKLLVRARKCVSDIPQQERLFGTKLSKAEIHTWLAWQEEPGRPMGQAITKKYLDGYNPTAEAFLAWMKAWLT